MNRKIKNLLQGKGGNYILPFFWQHGEEEGILRRYMEVIHNCGIGAVCVESRPHPDFAGPKWWLDMDIIMDEARKRGMKVWILDDSHFPTGYCNGALKDAPQELCRQSVTYQIAATVKKGEAVTLKRDHFENPKPFERNMVEQFIIQGEMRTFGDDRLLGVIAVKVSGQDDKNMEESHSMEESHCLTALTEKDGMFMWTAPEGEWKIYVCHLTRNRGPHRDYMNMMDRESCRKLIEAVYEPHYERYKDDFGKTIAGFFSDEPEIGNGHLYEMGKTLEEVDDQPWSREIEEELKKRWGAKWHLYIPLIWERDFDSDLKAKIRYDYMDVVTRCVEKDFSYQVGDWCRAHGVAYIGHLIEDNNQHSRTGSSLGHFFRGLAGQDMAGIDDIGGQVLPQGEDLEMQNFFGGNRDGVFYHYALGKLGASAGAIEPLKQGRTMCEIFGNYGWEEGVHLEKYLADHFMVRGINHYVPHAFSPKEFPDPDCPPHFYAHGHNPQYRHFGKLMNYMNRVCELISDGYHTSPAAILYHGEADWTGRTCMFSQEPARILADRQIDYDFLPSDVFAEEKYNTIIGRTLKVNTQEYKVLIVPETSYVTAQFAQATAELTEKGFLVVFINRLPTGICNGDYSLLNGISGCKTVSLEGLTDYLDSLGVAEIQISPANRHIRYLHYHNGSDMYYLVNEGLEKYCGTVSVPSTGDCYAYNPWDNVLERVSASEADGKTKLTVSIEPKKSLIVLFDTPDLELKEPIKLEGKAEELKNGWKRSTCEAIHYPVFTGEKEVGLPDKLEEEQPGFAGFVRYEKEVELGGTGKIILEITDAAEGVEVFINDVSAGIQIVPAYLYDITELIRKGRNRIVIEVATTLERAVEKKSMIPGMPPSVPTNRCGISGNVNLWLSAQL